MADQGHAAAYTPTLAVTADTVIRRERRLPLAGEVHVRVGDLVDAERLVASAALPGRVSALNVARELNIPPGEVAPRMLKQEGDSVKQGEPLAEYKSFFGFFRSQALSPASGTVETVSSVTGQALILGAPLGVALTGKEQLGITVVLTEGFGQLAMAAETYALLRSHRGERASLNGATQIRAGVLRPEIVMPLQGSPGIAPQKPAARLEPGARVRLVREPYFGALGVVSSLPEQPEQIETEALVRVLHARLDDGREVTVPRANVELIER